MVGFIIGILSVLLVISFSLNIFFSNTINKVSDKIKELEKLVIKLEKKEGNK